MELKPGSRFQSAVCETQVIVVRAPSSPVELECGGHPMVPVGTAADGLALDGEQAEGTAVGKRYVSDEHGLEVLCTKAGDGSLSISGERLPLKDAKPLPASD